MVFQSHELKDEDSSKKEELSDLDSFPLQISQMEKMAAIGQLSSSVAHEMRNLLGMIRTAAFNIDRAVNHHDDSIKNNLEIITRSVGRAKEFIDHLLNLSCMPRGKEEWIDVCQFVDQLLTLFAKELEWRNIQLKRKYQTIPPFRMDCHALQECLVNLVLNAIQSIEKKGVLTVEIIKENQTIRICIEDTGEGIDPENLERIFDRFYTTKRHDQGTGLGLTIARSLSRNMGGDITVESKKGVGSRFYLRLPVYPLVRKKDLPSKEAGKEKQKIHVL